MQYASPFSLLGSCGEWTAESTSGFTDVLIFVTGEISKRAPSVRHYSTLWLLAAYDRWRLQYFEKLSTIRKGPPRKYKTKKNGSTAAGFLVIVRLYWHARYLSEDQWVNQFIIVLTDRYQKLIDPSEQREKRWHCLLLSSDGMGLQVSVYRELY